MTAADWATTLAGFTATAAFIGVIGSWIMRTWMKGFLSELKPNGGSSMKDQITRLEEKTEKIFDLMIEHLKDHSK